MNILNQVPTKGTLRRIMKQAVFGTRVHCPHCGSRYIRSIKREERWRCRSCQLPFSLKSSCWLRGSKLPLETIWMLLWCWQKKFSLQHTMEIVGVSYPTVSRWYQLFREHIPQERIDQVVGGQVVCDEMFTSDTAIMGVKEKGTRNVMLRVLHEKHPHKGHAVDFLTQFVRTNSDLFTDGAGIYKGIDNWHKLRHTYERHNRFEFTLTAEIEGLWGVFRTFVRRMYHHVTIYKLEAVVAEFCLRFRQDEIFNSPQEYWRICLGEKPFAL